MLNDVQPISNQLIAFQLENMLRELNCLFRVFNEEMLETMIGDYKEENPTPYVIPDSIQNQVQIKLQNLCSYLTENYSKLPKNKRIEIKYYPPLNDFCEEMLISTALKYAFAFYFNLDLIKDPEVLRLGNAFIDDATV